MRSIDHSEQVPILVGMWPPGAVVSMVVDSWLACVRVGEDRAGFERSLKVHAMLLFERSLKQESGQ